MKENNEVKPEINAQITELETKLEKITKRLKKEVAERELSSEIFGRAIEEQKRYSITVGEKEQRDVDDKNKYLQEEIIKLEKIKEDILGYTLQIITIVIAVFAIIFSISFFTITSSTPSDYFKTYGDWVIILFVTLVGILSIWCLVWMKKEGVLFKKYNVLKVQNMMNKSEYQNRKNLLLGVVIGALFGLVGSLTSGYYFWSMNNHPEDQWKALIGFVGFAVVIAYCLMTIRKLDKIETSSKENLPTLQETTQKH